MKKVITYGTFDLFHKGHYNILKRAREHGDYLIVGVTSDSYDIERGKLNVRDDLLTRIKNVEATDFADKIILEEYQGQKISDIAKYDIDTLVIGSDWVGKFDYLKEFCEVLYLDRTKDISSTQLREDGAATLRIGMVTDDTTDHELTSEVRFVSGLHVEGVFSPSIETARKCKRKYELAFATDDYQAFLEKVDIVYIKTGITTRTSFVEKALQSSKPVIVEPPISLNDAEVKKLQSLAKKNNTVLMEKVTLAYLRAFTQLVWHLHGGLIGSIISIGSNLNLDESNIDLLQAKIINLFAIRKLLSGQQEPKLRYFFQKDSIASSYLSGIFEQGNAIANFEIVAGINKNSELNIYGTKGSLHVPDDWSTIGHFQVDLKDPSAARQHYSFNFEGNGFRYLLSELLLMIDEGRVESTRYTNLDSISGIRLLEKLSTKAT